MPDTKSYLSKVQLPSGSIYHFKDADAWDKISDLESAITKAVHYAGITTTEVTDGSTVSTLIIDGESVTFTTDDAGAVVLYGEREFIWNGAKWQEFGAAGSFGALAFKDSASGDYTPSGTVSVAVATTSNQTATVSTEEIDGSHAATYTPAGSVTLTNENKTATVSKAATGTATYTPEGSVAAPSISVKTAGSTTTVKNPTKVTVAKTVVAAAPGATAPDNAVTYYSVTGETLSLYQLGYTTGDSITTSDVTVKTGDADYEATAPEFTGTGARLVTDNISVPASASFSGTGARLVTGNIAVPNTFTGTFTGNEDTITVS